MQLQNLKHHQCPTSLRSWALLFFLSSVSFLSFAQPVYPSDWGLKRFAIKDKQIGDISFYVDTTKIKQKAPLLIYANGSGGYPLVIYLQKGKGAQVLTTFDELIIKNAKDDYHVIVLDKPGIQFCDTIVIKDGDTTPPLELYPIPAYYNEHLSLSWRIDAIKAVITYMIKNGYHDGKKIVAWGFSEGGQVVPRLAAQDKRITHVVSQVGAGLNQFYDFISSSRIRVAKGELTAEQGQQEVDTYLKIFRDIYSDPTSTTKFFSGHTYKRWASFCSDDAVDSFAKLDIPIYMLVGSADVNSPIYGLDYVPLEFARLGKKNLIYDVCVGCDHFQTVIESGDAQEKGKSRGNEIMIKILDWIAKRP